MFISVSSRAYSIAVTSKQRELEAQIEGDRKEVRERAFQQLHDGAVHNGLKPSASDLDAMNKMVDNDLEHQMEQHPAKHLMKILGVQQQMIAFQAAQDTPDDHVVIHESDFELVGKYLNDAEDTRTLEDHGSE